MKAAKTVKKEKTELEMWKDEYKKIYKSYIGDKEYIWRRINRKEYAEIMEIKDGDTVEDRIYNRQAAMVKKVVLGMDSKELAEDLEELSGLAISLSDEIMNMSGFNVSLTKEL